MTKRAFKNLLQLLPGGFLLEQVKEEKPGATGYVRFM